MKKAYVNPQMHISPVRVRSLICTTSDLTKTESNDLVLGTHGRNSYDDEDASNAAETGWTDGLW